MLDVVGLSELAKALRADIRSGILSPDAYSYAVEELYRVERLLESAAKEIHESSNGPRDTRV